MCSVAQPSRPPSDSALSLLRRAQSTPVVLLPPTLPLIRDAPTTAWAPLASPSSDPTTAADIRVVPGSLLSPGHVAVVAGETGVGKSTLLAIVAAHHLCAFPSSRVTWVQASGSFDVEWFLHHLEVAWRHQQQQHTSSSHTLASSSHDTRIQHAPQGSASSSVSAPLVITSPNFFDELLLRMTVIQCFGDPTCVRAALQAASVDVARTPESSSLHVVHPTDLLIVDGVGFGNFDAYDKVRGSSTALLASQLRTADTAFFPPSDIAYLRPTAAFWDETVATLAHRRSTAAVLGVTTWPLSDSLDKSDRDLAALGVPIDSSRSGGTGGPTTSPPMARKSWGGSTTTVASLYLRWAPQGPINVAGSLRTSSAPTAVSGFRWASGFAATAH